MSARDVDIDKLTDIASGAAQNGYAGTIFTGRDRDNIELGLRRLTAAGYTLIPPGGMHEPTLETLRAARKFIARFDGKMPTAREDEGVFALLERIDEALSHEGGRKG